MATILSKLILSPFTSPGRSSSIISPPIYRSTYLSDTDSLMEDLIENARFVIAQWDVQGTSLFRDDRSDARLYIQSVRDLQSVMHRLIKQDPNSEMLLPAHSLMEAAMKRLGKEFSRMLSSSFIHDDSDHEPSVSGQSTARSSVSDHTVGGSSSEDDSFCLSDDQESVVTSVSEQTDSAGTLADLKAIAECMIAAGYGRECMELYKSVRKLIVNEELNRLGITTTFFSKKKQKLDWEVLERKIRSWLSAVGVAVRSVFRQERILSRRVFASSPKIGKACYSEITRDGEILVFHLAENLAKYLRKESPERIFYVLDMFRAITNLWRELKRDFDSDSSSAVQSHCVNALVILRKTVRGMLTGFESLIQKDSSKTAVPGGGVHPLTQFSMNYLTSLADYGDALQDIVADWPLNVKGALPGPLLSTGKGPSDEVYSATSTRLAWLILVLLSKLDVKAELYRGDVALSYLFLANNLQYVVVRVRDSNLRNLLGLEWIETHESKVKHYAASYERIGWGNAFSSLPDLTQPTAEISLEEAGNVFRSFNAAFKETYRKMTTCIVPDPKLRDHIGASLKDRIGSGYRAFYGKHKDVVDGWEELGEPVVAFAPEDVENYLSELFSGPGDARRVTSSWSSSESSYPPSLARSIPVKARGW